MENLTVELNGVKYLIVECPIYDANKNKIEARCKRHGVIVQGIVKLERGGWFSEPIVVLRMLVPEHNVWEWNVDES